MKSRPWSVRFVAIVFGLWAIVAAVALLLTTLREMLPNREPPKLASEPAQHAPLTRHLLLLIPDGLRYDHATNPAMAPNIARHMREDAHGTVWAGRVTMTAAAVMCFGTGRPGSYSELITNLNARRIGYDDVFVNARAAGLRTALAGDPTWSDTFGDFDEQVHDANGMAIDVDNSREIFAAAEKIVTRPDAPSFLVTHLIATDHQGHAYQSASETYWRFLAKFDADVQKFLDKVPADWTVMALSDHGQTDTGAHGTDTEIMRKTPMFAYGPGIRKGAALADVDQVDVAHTLAALLGTSPPAHGLGMPVLDLLDAPASSRAAIACSEARRVGRLARSEGSSSLAAEVERLGAPCADAAATPQAREDAARAAVQAYESLARSAVYASSPWSTALVIVVTALGFLLLALLAVRSEHRLPVGGAVRFAIFACGVAALAVFLTFRVERITPPYHNVVRAVLFVGGIGALLWGLLRPSRAARLFDANPTAGLALLPGALAVSYTANTQVLSLVVLVLGSALWLFAPHADLHDTPSLRNARRALPWWRIGLVVAALAALVPFGIRNDAPTPEFLTQRPRLLLVLSLAAIAAWLAAGARAREDAAHGPRGPGRADLVAAVVVALAAVVARRFIPSSLGLLAIFAFPVLAVLAASRRRFTLAFGLGFAAYAWVSRDIELLPVACTALVVEALAQGAASSAPAPASPDGRLRPFAIATIVAVLFSSAYLLRVGLQGGLDLGNIDYGVGSFGNPGVGQGRLVGAQIWKFAAASMLLVGSALRSLPNDLKLPVAFGFVAVFLARSGAVVWILFTCRASYWSAMRSLADSPTALVLTIAGALMLWAVALPARARSETLPAE
jgi:ABC-type sugar transport system permease subunit